MNFDRSSRVSGFVLTSPELKNGSGFRGLFYKPLDKKVALVNPEVITNPGV
jgi:hypothetical protein